MQANSLKLVVPAQAGMTQGMKLTGQVQIESHVC